ncbi:MULTISPECIES: hypothetical protein [Enterococcus]|uniref:hypothetical protein n=1 Tax=Enterococcus TaxID=1350 RepID=UPI00035C985C|nr:MULTISPECIES: hypothetical protein [unclassified Enterococcus]EPH61129.1 hypothetical protein D931_02806 [Enterococcus faecium 13.SD.W.09]MBK0036703.1 hypothetical protein [Enterococcus sp. S52]MBK0069366.1 hypothetical protein [Enterococcus sp. S53]MBK0139959.1 hypothetical protein [Enterococcus sp. S76]MBK0143582.1 hypothetical protein [Enterococcus sp. S77]
MYVFIVWKYSISGWSKEILEVFDSERKAREYVQTLSGKPQYEFNIQKILVN